MSNNIIIQLVLTVLFISLFLYLTGFFKEDFTEEEIEAANETYEKYQNGDKEFSIALIVMGVLAIILAFICWHVSGWILSVWGF